MLFLSGVGIMKMSNVHERTIAAPAARVGALLDSLASADDKFWPYENWPGVKFNLPLQVGATGGHGTGPYTVSSYTPGRHIRFEFCGRRQGYYAAVRSPGPEHLADQTWLGLIKAHGNLVPDFNGRADTYRYFPKC
jgi:hypothetical protein